MDTTPGGRTRMMIRKTHRYTVSNVESQVFTHNNSLLLAREANPGWPRDK